MPEITKHVETMFSYADLSTTDLEGAKKFYTELFDWQVEDVPMGPNDFYAMFKKNGKTTAAAANQRKEQADAGVPPMWNTYFTVTDVDNRSKQAERAGGTIHAQPFDVFEAGRMSVISSPSGAFFSLWQAKNDIGAQIMNEPNTLTWTECISIDVERTDRSSQSCSAGMPRRCRPTPETSTSCSKRTGNPFADSCRSPLRGCRRSGSITSASPIATTRSTKPANSGPTSKERRLRSPGSDVSRW